MNGAALPVFSELFWLEITALAAFALALIACVLIMVKR
jgi:hypothetical protein